MCGICGIVGKSDAGLVKSMCSSLVRRGPDDEGIYIGENGTIGSHRLKIVGLLTGYQPFFNEIESKTHN